VRRTGYYCPGPGQLVEGRGARHLRIGGAVIDSVVAEAFLTALAQWRRQLEQARYQAGKVECRYRAVDRANRLEARGLEADWERTLTALTAAQTELDRCGAARSTTLTDEQRAAILALGEDLDQVWTAPSTTDRDRQQLLRTLLDEVNITVHRDHIASRVDLASVFRRGCHTPSVISVQMRRGAPD